MPREALISFEDPFQENTRNLAFTVGSPAFLHFTGYVAEEIQGRGENGGRDELFVTVVKFRRSFDKRNNVYTRIYALRCCCWFANFLSCQS